MNAEEKGEPEILHLLTTLKEAFASGISYSRESDVGDFLETRFREAPLEFLREHRLSRRDRIDFFLPDRSIGIEIKVEASAIPVIRQVLRYAESPEIAGLIIVTVRPLKIPPLLSGKPVANFAFWRYL